MSKILYIVDIRENKNYTYNIEEDTVIYHFAVDSSSDVVLNLNKEGVSVDYYYSNYNDNTFKIDINHLKDATHSEVYNHGVNILDKKLTYYVTGKVEKTSYKCICNQDNQIINMNDGKSTICPNLLIDNYDVVSNHAAYIGKFKDELLFYMMSRGISRDSAYHLLLNGFLIQSDSISFDQIKDFVDEIEKI